VKRIHYVIDAVKVPALLIDEHTFIKKEAQFLDVYRSKKPIKGEVVSSQNDVRGVEILLNQAGQALEVEELAAMTVAEFTQYLHIEGGY
jgi:NADP-dependent 3-hydroxy acid dehydrogenase YdfG